MARRGNALFWAINLLLSSTLIFAGLAAAADPVKDLQDKGRAALNTALAKSKTCTKEKLQIRKEWSNLTTPEKKAYIAAVQCIMSAKSKVDAKAVPGARTRYDDFVAIHIQQTLQIHGTGSFLSWHRYYTWAYEQVLRNECGYNGTQPYWDWSLTADDPTKSPIFDGSDTSLGGNGKLITGHKGNMVGPAGQGGGCVETGPFKNMTVALGPCNPQVDPAPKANPATNCLGYNPRCLRRDMSNYFTTRYTKPSDVVALISKPTTIGAFQDKMQAGDGVHSAGHFTINGDPGADFYTSPGDPAFWLQHGMIDRTWYIWQTQDFEKRQQVIAGGTSMMGGGKLQSLEDTVDLGVLASKTYKIKELVSTVEGPFCYAYE